MYYRGAGAKSKEKLLVVSYAMKAMGLNRLAEVAAQILKSKTGLQVDWWVPGSSSAEAEAAAEVEAAEVESIKAEPPGEIKSEGIIKAQTI